jgi:hypothetical protein
MARLTQDDLTKRRLAYCVEVWPECYSGGYNPNCCRFPKSCSPHGRIEAFETGNLTEDSLEPIVISQIGGKMEENSSHKYRKKPVVIEALRWDGSVENATLIINWILDGGGTARYDDREDAWDSRINIETIEGTMSLMRGNWAIKGVQGEFYPCKEDIFEATYEMVVE